MEFTFEDAVAPKIERTGRTEEPNPFEDVVASLVKAEQIGTGKGKTFTMPGLASVKDNEKLAKVRRQLTKAGAKHNVSVRWNCVQEQKVTKTNEGVIRVTFHLVPPIKRQKPDTSAVDNAAREGVTETPASK